LGKNEWKRRGVGAMGRDVVRAGPKDNDKSPPDVPQAEGAPGG